MRPRGTATSPHAVHSAASSELAAFVDTLLTRRDPVGAGRQTPRTLPFLMCGYHQRSVTWLSGPHPQAAGRFWCGGGQGRWGEGKRGTSGALGSRWRICSTRWNGRGITVVACASGNRCVAPRITFQARPLRVVRRSNT
jgi:hypothetical protein